MREALTALQLQGLIEIRPQSGSFVFMPSEEDVAELAEFRRVMEVTALRFCFARRRDETLRQMRVAARRDGARRDADDRLGVARADTAFHQAIAENSANEYLIAAYRLVSGRVAALRTHNLHGRGHDPRPVARRAPGRDRGLRQGRPRPRGDDPGAAHLAHAPALPHARGRRRTKRRG